MKEKLFQYFFPPPYFGGGGGEHIFKYIFTTVFWVEKIYSNSFSPPYFVGKKYIQIYFHHRILLGENIFKYIFSPQNTVVKKIFKYFLFHTWSIVTVKLEIEIKECFAWDKMSSFYQSVEQSGISPRGNFMALPTTLTLAPCLLKVDDCNLFKSTVDS